MLYAIPIILFVIFLFLLETKARATIQSWIIKSIHENNQYY